MFPSIFSSAVQLVDVDYAGVLAEMVLNPEPTTIEIPAWAVRTTQPSPGHVAAPQLSELRSE
eukprot:scaffold337_cov393-Prasinococcus_capsulatus_cf.AAC.17